MAALREKITFEPNVPALVTMEFNSGKKVADNRGGEQYQYFLEGQRIMYVDTEVAELIIASRAKAGDTLEITKRERRIGQQKRVDWEVIHVPANDLTDEPDYAHAEPQGRPAPLQSQPRPAARPAAQQQPAAATASMTQQMANAFFAAVDAANVAEQYAQERGRRLILDADALRALAITIFIEGCKK
jgi:hypothetical protein